jgi:hypothetical protein
LRVDKIYFSPYILVEILNILASINFTGGKESEVMNSKLNSVNYLLQRFSRLSSLLLLASLLVISGCASPGIQATQTPISTATPGSQAAATLTSEPETVEINLYLIALEDEGQTGEPVGCGDSLVAVPIQVDAADNPLHAAYERLLAIKERIVQPNGLYNALYQSDLRLEEIRVNEAGLAQVYLSGSYQLGGVCDDPRFEAQLTQTALQFPQVQQVEVFINGEPLQDLLSLRG